MNDTAAQTATYRVTFTGQWTDSVTTDGVPPTAHFTTLIGAVHNDRVSLWSAGTMASKGIEHMAEAGTTGTLKTEIQALGMDALAVIEKSVSSGATGTASVDVTVTPAHPLVTIVSMIAPSPDWFVGVSGLSLQDDHGGWSVSQTEDLYPYDAGTEDGTEFALDNPETSPQANIASIKGMGKFSNEVIATLTFTRLSPNITTPSAFTANENQMAVSTLSATDAEDDDLEWSIPSGDDGGPDADKFSLSSAGVLAFQAAPDYEYPTDADGDNVYSVTVSVSDGTNASQQEIDVTVANVDEAGSVSLFPTELRVRTVVRATLADPDGATIVAWQWARSSDQATWVPISGSRGTRASYQPSGDDQHNFLRVRATYTDRQGPGKTAQAISSAMVAEREAGPALSVKELIRGLSKPWGIAFTPDGTMLYTQRSGRIRARLTDGTNQRVTADFSDLATNGNNGLMAIVVDPAFAMNQRFYTCQGHTGPKVQVIAWTIDSTYTTATRVSDPLIEGIPAGRNHHGCRLRFGSDGYLYVATGDTEADGTAPQDILSLGGKVLRVNSSTGAAPPDNPTSGSLVYTYGHRNPQGLVLRPGTDQMWVVEHGPTRDDEINLLTAGANYGWDPTATDENGNPISGYDDSQPMTDLEKFPDAREAKWSSGNPTLATSGGIFLEGEHWEGWEGRLAVATLKNRTLHIFEFTAAGELVSHIVPPELDHQTGGHPYGRLRTPMLDGDGALYISTDVNGRILRVTPHQAPEFAEDAYSPNVPENADANTVVATVEATDFNHDALTYSLGGTDAASFRIPESNVGELKLAPGTRLDYETRQSYEVTVTATDPQATSDTAIVTLAVTDIEHEGTVALSSTQPEAGSPLTATLSDPDGGVTATTWTWERSADGVDDWVAIDGADAMSYTPGADDVGMYLRATVSYTNTHGSGKVAKQVTHQPVRAAANTNPEFASESTTRRVAENTPAGQSIGAPVTTADEDPLHYALSGDDADRFDINGSSGQLLTKTSLDYETQNEYQVVVSVSDRKDSTGAADTVIDDEIAVTIAVDNEDEPGTVSLVRADPLRVHTVVRATLSDPDGGVHSVAWRWDASADKTNWTTVSGATEADFLPTETQRGRYLRAIADYTDGQGSGKAAQADSTVMVDGPESAPTITIVELVSGLHIPWGLAFAPDGTMLFTERSGGLSSRRSDGTVQSVTADFADLALSGQIGLMGIAVDPDFSTNRRFYTCQGYTGSEVQVIRWTIDANYASATRISDPLVGGVPAGSQNGGCRLRFGPDGFLWITTGDGRVGTTPQDLNSLGGKILRVDRSTGATAPGNPFSTRIYTYGHRNPQGLARRPGTRQMWAVEHGPRVDDEINLLVSGGNYGWDPVPGYNDSVAMTDLERHSSAVEAKWSSGSATLAGSGGVFLEGDAWGNWEGRLAVAALKDTSLHLFEFTAGGDVESHLVPPAFDGTYGRLRTPMLDPDGALYLTTSNGSNRDRILKVAPGRAPTFAADTEIVHLPNNSAPTTVVAHVQATDADGDQLTYELGGPDAGSFDINAATGEIRLGTATVIDKAVQSSYEVVVTASDRFGLSASITLTILVSEVEDAALVFDKTSVTVPEGGTAGYTVSLNAKPIQNVAVSVSGIAGDLSLDTTDLLFTPGDWGAAQTITVRADEDADTLSDPAVILTHMATGGGYDGVEAEIRVTITENDRPPSTGGGGGGGGANRPPVIESQIEDQRLDAGTTLELDVYLNFYDRDQRALDYTIESAHPEIAEVEIDRNGVITITGIRRGVTAITVTAADRREESVSQSFRVTVQGPALVALVPHAAGLMREGFVRVINHSPNAGEVSIEAIDDTGTLAGPVTLALGANETAHFNSKDLEDGNAAKGLSGGVGPGEGDWRLVLDSDLDFEVLSYIRTTDGFLTAMHDVVPMRDGRYRVAVFNPGSNQNQMSRLRLINPGGETATVTVEGIDDAGASPGAAVTFAIPAGRSTTLTASELESGSGLDGALGDGAGKWRLDVTANTPVVAMSLLSSPTGHLTNLSTVPRTPAEDGHHVVPLFPAASDALGRQGFVRVINRSDESGTVSVEAFDDSEIDYEVVTLALNAGQTRHFNSNDLELGNAGKGLTGSTGVGMGDWRLVLSSDLDINVLAYIRTADGFLTSMHDTTPDLLGERHVAIFNPGSNPNQVSRLRLVNPGDEDALVTITGIDDAGAPGGAVTVTVPAGASRTIEAANLEAGANGFEGALGDGAGKWRLTVVSEQPIIVMSLLSSPTGHLTNLSTAPDRGVSVSVE